MVNEGNGMAVSIGLIVLGNLIKLKSKTVGDFVQGVGIGSGIETIGHTYYKTHTDGSPHHDVIAFASMPAIFYVDKAKIIENKTLLNNMYGASVGALAQHLITEGCSFCRTDYCENGDTLC